MDLDVGELPSASVAVLGLLILLAKDAPLRACGMLEVAFVCREELCVVEELERLDGGVPALAPAADREAAWKVWLGPEGNAPDLAFEDWVGRCMRASRADGLGIMDDVSWSNFFFRSLTLGLFAGSPRGMTTGDRSLLMGAETERRPGRSSVRVFVAVGGGRGA